MEEGPVNSFVLAVHGGAGALERERLAPDAEAAARRGLEAALRAGHAVLADGGRALDAVVRAVATLEDDPAFNAGRGSVLTSEGRVEMDAAVVDGATLAAGAVACVSRLAHPVETARLVMEHSPHVLLAGEGAERFALAHGAEAVDPEALVTELRRGQLERVRARVALDHDGGGLGTVGAVARDRAGHVAAATSTGGMTGQLPGRVGDSPIVGAGTWADDASCAVSATGHGELFVRVGFAHEVDALVRHAGLALGEACRRVLERVAALGGRGGCVAVDRRGAVALPFSSAGMFRGRIDAAGRAGVAVFGGETP